MLRTFRSTPSIMREALTHLNYLAVFVVAIAGFLLGWLWYGPLFGKIWITEMKLTPEKMQAAREKGMAGYFIKGFVCTLLSTFGLAVLLQLFNRPDWIHGAVYGAFFGFFMAGARLLNSSVWEEKSARL